MLNRLRRYRIAILSWTIAVMFVFSLLWYQGYLASWEVFFHTLFSGGESFGAGIVDGFYRGVLRGYDPKEQMRRVAIIAVVLAALGFGIWRIFRIPTPPPAPPAAPPANQGGGNGGGGNNRNRRQNP